MASSADISVEGQRILSTLNEDGTRRWIKPRTSPGWFLGTRRGVAWFLILLFTVAPLTAMVTVVILLLWIFSAYKVYRVVSRLSYLESFLHVCAWCRKIEYNDRWLSLEAHFTEKTGGGISHGICPECAKRILGRDLGKR